MLRGHTVCWKKDCFQYHVGLVFKEISSYSDHGKLKFIENAWKPGELFQVTSQRQWNFRIQEKMPNPNCHFAWSWLKIFPWLAYSKWRACILYIVVFLESSVGEIRINLTNCTRLHSHFGRPLQTGYS